MFLSNSEICQQITPRYFGTRIVAQKPSNPIPLYLMILLLEFPMRKCLWTSGRKGLHNTGEKMEVE